MSISKICDDYLAARHEWEEAKKFASHLHDRVEAKKTQLIDAMLAENMRAYPRKDGLLISLRRSFSCSVTQENTDQIREWLVEKLGDDKPYVKEVVDKPALTEHLKEMAETTDLADFPEFLRVSTRPDVAVRGWNRDDEP